MPKILRVRAARDEREEKQVRKLAGSRHGPADWIGACAHRGAKPGMGSGWKPSPRNCSAVHKRYDVGWHRFDYGRHRGLGERPKPGRPRRLTTEDATANRVGAPGAARPTADGHRIPRAAGLRARAGEDLGLRSAACT